MKRTGLSLRLQGAWKVLALSLSTAFVGCTTISHPLGPITPPPSYKFLTGNWQFTTSPTTGSATFGAFAGFIDEQSIDPGVDDPTTASLQIQEPAMCFLGTIVVPFQGDTKGTAVGFQSFNDVSQFLSISATADATATHLNGTYAVGGGCASGSMGTLSGTKYDPLVGTYDGPVTGSTSTSALSLALNQTLLANGNGSFNVTGSGTFQGNACFTQGTLTADSYVVGSAVNLVLTTNEAGGSTVTLTGTFDPTADMINVANLTTSGGACSGTGGTATLTLQ